ncbi:MAG: hypothetical protein WA701_03675 [Solirubrobacterales bacterium]
MRDPAWAEGSLARPNPVLLIAHLDHVLALERVEELVLVGVDMQGCVREGWHLLHHTERTAGAGGVGVDADVNLPEGECRSRGRTGDG